MRVVKSTYKYTDLSWSEQYDFEVSDLFTQARSYAGLTQQKLARKMQTKQPGIARLECGSYLPSHATLKKLAKATGMKLLPPQLVSYPISSKKKV